MNIPVPFDSSYPPPPQHIDFLKYFQAFFGFFLIIMLCWSLVELILGLFRWVTSGQDMEKKTLAKARALKGLGIFILMIVVWAVVLFLQSFFGIGYRL